jgi:hypothetical protein
MIDNMNSFKIGDKIKNLWPTDEMNHSCILIAKTPICTVSKIEGDYVFVEETKRFGEIGNVGYHYTGFELLK